MLQRHCRLPAPARRGAAHRRPYPGAAAPRRAPRSAGDGPAPAPPAAAANSPSSQQQQQPFDINERMEWLKGDLVHLFDDVGVDPNGYDSQVTFLDPITKYDSVQGYLFNIKFLKLAFTPTFILHDARQTGPTEVTTRWTMAMKFSPARALGLSKIWDPEITFTGTSAYGFNPANGKINRHIDTWDSIDNQRFFSFEAFGDFLRQVGQRYTTPQGLESPQYTLLKRAKDYQIRRYEPYLYAETPLDGVDSIGSPNGSSGSPNDNGSPEGNGSPDGGSSSSGEGGGFSPASPGVKAFGELAGYLFGGNAEGRKLKMTAPVLSDTAGTMRFIIGPSDAKDISEAPAPGPSARVTLRRDPGGDYAAAIFGGVATPRACREAEAALRAALLRDGLRPLPGYALARWNDPGVKPERRRNEVLIALEPGSFDLWA